MTHLIDTKDPKRDEIDGIIIRHPSSGAPRQLAEWLPGTSIINAGDGHHQHPTQALLDSVTMRQRIGDIAHSRVSSDFDAVMTLRVQAERMDGGFFPSHRECSAIYGLSADRPNTSVLAQVTNGVYTRMAVLFALLAGEES